MGTWSREELQEAHDGFIAAAAEAGRTGDWSIWADRFTEDAEYHEHLYGKFHGRDEILAWISKTMGEWPNTEMTQFPHNWCVCDEERGWWICQIRSTGWVDSTTAVPSASRKRSAAWASADVAASAAGSIATALAAP